MTPYACGAAGLLLEVNLGEVPRVVTPSNGLEDVVLGALVEAVLRVVEGWVLPRLVVVVALLLEPEVHLLGAGLASSVVAVACDLGDTDCLGADRAGDLATETGEVVLHVACGVVDPAPHAVASLWRASLHACWDLEVGSLVEGALAVDGDDGKVFRLELVEVRLVGNGKATSLGRGLVEGCGEVLAAGEVEHACYSGTRVVAAAGVWVVTVCCERVVQILLTPPAVGSEVLVVGNVGPESTTSGDFEELTSGRRLLVVTVEPPALLLPDGVAITVDLLLASSIVVGHTEEGAHVHRVRGRVVVEVLGAEAEVSHKHKSATYPYMDGCHIAMWAAAGAASKAMVEKSMAMRKSCSLNSLVE